MLLKSHPEFLRLYNDVFAKTPKKNFINNLLYWNKKIPNEQKKILEKIKSQLDEIYESLKPLAFLGITFDFWLVGGSVRDLLLGRYDNIKDLDILISFSSEYSTAKIPTLKQFKKYSGFNFDLPQVKSIITRDSTVEPFQHWDTYYRNRNKSTKRYNISLIYKAVLFDMFACALGQKFDMYEIFKPSMEKQITSKDAERYMDLRLNGVIKIKKDNWTWPVDILISNYDIDYFLEAFDFGVCKVALAFNRQFEQRRHIFTTPQTPEEMLHGIRLTSAFIEDVLEKKLTINVSYEMTVKQLQHSLEKHLLNIEKKYPWEVKFDLSNSYEETLINAYIKSFLDKKTLDNSFGLKEVRSEKKTII